MLTYIYRKLWLAVHDLRQDERGVSAIEYAILAGIIIVVVATAVMGFGDRIQDLFTNASTAISAAADSSDGLSD